MMAWEITKDNKMKEIIGDDYPTYEESVNLTLAEKQKAEALTYLTEVESEINKQNIERLMKENLELRHRLSCIADDIEIIDRHIKNNCNKRFKRPSLNKDGSIYADEAWHNVTNIEIACDLNDDEPLYWGSKIKGELTQDQIMKMEQQMR
jgi:IS1 family transposase